MYKAKWNKPDYQSHDDGYSWRIIGNWRFNRYSFPGEITRIEFYGAYAGKKNYCIYARLENGEIVYNNPRRVSIPLYAQQILKDMLAQTK